MSGIFVVSSSALKNLATRRGRLTPLHNRRAIHKAMIAGPANAWLATDALAAADLLAEASCAKTRLDQLVLLEPPRLNSLAAAMDLFRSVIWADNRKRWLALEEMIDVLNSSDPRDYVVGGMVDQQTARLTLYRGDFSRLTVPLAIFEPTPNGVQIDPTDFEVIDNGLAVRLGAYEAAADAIFYECDPGYRQRLRRQRREEEKTFGPVCGDFAFSEVSFKLILPR